MSPETIPRRSWTAIYTRQSRSSNADFSSCEAQLSVCLTFVMARVCDGWVWNGKRYDDEGQSGETLNRRGYNNFLPTFAPERSIESYFTAWIGFPAVLPTARLCFRSSRIAMSRSSS